MLKSNCSKARSLILESEGGQIESADALWLESHIQACTACRHESRELETLIGAWKSAAPPRLSADQRSRIEKAVLDADVVDAATVIPRRAQRTYQRTWKVPTMAAGLAATIAVASLAVFWSKRQRSAPPVAPNAVAATTTPAPAPQTARVTSGTLHVYGPTGDARVFRNAMSAPWNTLLRTTDQASCVLAVGPHATLALAPGTQVTLRHQASDTVVAVSRGTIAIDVRSPGTRRAGQFRVWISGRGEVTTQDARLVVARGATGVAISSVRGWLRYGWTQGGIPQVANLEAGEQLTHRLDTVRRGVRAPDINAGMLLAGRYPGRPAASPGHRPSKTAASAAATATAPRGQRPDNHKVLAQRAQCAAENIQRTLARRDGMGALRTLEACRAAGRDSKDLRALEAQANLQVGRVRRAFNQYLAVAHSFRGSPAGQTALYSAGRLALNRLAHKSQAKRLLQHYLHTYPKGAHRANIQQMLRRL